MYVHKVVRESVVIWPSHIAVLVEKEQKILGIDQERTDDDRTQNAEQQRWRITAHDAVTLSKHQFKLNANHQRFYVILISFLVQIRTW